MRIHDQTFWISFQGIAMRKLLIPLFLYPLSCFAGDVHVDIAGVEPGVGQVVVSVWDSEENYLNTAFLTKSVRVEILQGGKLRVTFSEALPQQCAINVFYDKNSNGELDTNWMGIPSEPVGITNNVKGRFGPPEYEEGKVTITGDKQVFVIQVEEL